MHRFRRILVRWDKKPEHDVAFLHFTCTLIHGRIAGLFGEALRPTLVMREEGRPSSRLPRWERKESAGLNAYLRPQSVFSQM
jgi:hypothetical protein